MDRVKTSFTLQDLKFQTIAFGTPQFDESVALRNKLLRIPLGLEFSSGQIAEEWDSHHLGLYFNSGKLVASLVMKPLEGDTWKMRQVVVDDIFQGRGIGKILIQKTEDYCILYGVKKIVLHARDTAIPFYLSLSYELFGDPFEEVGIQHRAMTKTLESKKS